MSTLYDFVESHEPGDGCESETECPTCGEDFESVKGMKIHHSRTHGGDINDCFHNGVWNCPNGGCGFSCSTEEGLRSHYDFSHDSVLFGVVCEYDGCDREFKTVRDMRYHCSEAHGVISWQEERDCEQCGGMYEPEYKNQQFCSQECFCESRRGENNPNWDGGEFSDFPDNRECDECGGVYNPHRRSQQFCSQECFGESRRGENHPNWKGGGDVYYGPEWTEELRESIRDRDGRQCRDCGIDECELDRRLSVHHKYPVRLFDDPSHAHIPGNLVSLCPQCHRSWECVPGGYMPTPDGSVATASV